MGITVEDMDYPIESLLWVDDVIMAETESNNIEQNVADHTANKYHTDYVESKTNVLII